MSSFDNFYTRLQSLNEARKSPVEALVPGATGVTKQMRSAGLSSAPLDLIRFIRELLFDLDVITHEELKTVKMGKGFSGKKGTMLKVLQDNQDAINAKSDEIAQRIESTLDDFISGMGVNRSREEKYAAQAAAQELAFQARAAKSGKEMDDALADVISDEKILLITSLATTLGNIRLNLGDPGFEDIEEPALDEVSKFVKNINTVEQLKSFISQISNLPEYEKIAAYLSSIVKPIEQGTVEAEMEDQEDPDHGFDATKSDLNDDGNISKYERARGEAIASSMSKEDNENLTQTQLDAGNRLSAMYRKDMLADIDKMHKSMVDGGVDPTTGSKFSEAEISDLYKQAAERNLSKYIRVNKQSNGKQQDRVDVAQSILDNVIKTQANNKRPHAVENAEDPDIEALSQVEVEELGDGEIPVDYHNKDDKDAEDGEQAGHAAGSLDLEAKEARRHELAMAKAKAGIKDDKDEDEIEDEEDEEIVAESKYTTADYLTDIYSTVEPIIESTVNENGQTTPTQQYLVEKHEEAIEEVYTSQYLVEQKIQDTLPKQKKENNLSFKERFQPKTHWQLEEVRRYGL